MSFARRLRELRQSKGLSREQLADAADLAKATIRDYEQGKREPLLTSAVKLAAALGTDCRAFADCVAGDGKPAAKKTTKRKGK